MRGEGPPPRPICLQGHLALFYFLTSLFHLPALARRKADIKEVWIIAGDEALDSSFNDRLERASQKNEWTYLEIQLPTGGLVLHTSTAINYIMFAIDSGLMKQFVWEKERALMESDFSINLAVS